MFRKTSPPRFPLYDLQADAVHRLLNMVMDLPSSMTFAISSGGLVGQCRESPCDREQQAHEDSVRRLNCRGWDVFMWALLFWFVLAPYFSGIDWTKFCFFLCKSPFTTSPPLTLGLFILRVASVRGLSKRGTRDLLPSSPSRSSGAVFPPLEFP